MSEVHRVCPRCGASVALESRHCGRCGWDTSAGLPVERRNLPVQVGRAALPVVAGVAGLALRAGWKLLRRRLASLAETAGTTPTQESPQVQHPPAPHARRRPRRVIRIRSTWAIGDARGVWRQGQEEHIIEIDD